MSDITKYYNIQGRTYHDKNKYRYVLPTDTEETNRLIKQAKAIKTTLDGLFTAPINEQLEKGIKVLDAGCGPGIWSLEMAVKYKNSQYHGIDILEKQFPSKENTPSNVQFTVGNLAGNIPFPKDTFDFVYQRLLILAFTSKQWDDNLKEQFRIMKPDGYIELIEYDHAEMLDYGPHFRLQIGALAKYLSSQGIPLFVSLVDRVNKAGFVNVKNHVKKQLFCSPENEEQLTGDAIVSAYEGLGHNLASFVPEWKDENVYKDHLQQCRIETANNKVNLFCNVVTAQKPATPPLMHKQV